MKKSRIIEITLFCLMFFSLLNFTTAASPSYVGVAAGEQYTWVPSINFENVNATAISLVGEDNWTLAYNMLQELFENETGMPFDLIGGTGLRITIHNVTDELVDSGIRYAGVWFNVDVAMSANNWTRVVNATDAPSPMSRIINPADINETTFMYVFMSPELMPIGIDYDFLVERLNNITNSNPYTAGNYTYARSGSGLAITIKGQYLEMALNESGAPFNVTGLADIVATVRWNSIGVLEYASVSYGGLLLASASLSTDGGEIPGYIIPLMVGISACTLAVVIVIVKKKNKFIT
jgi:hypothetical protein